jgi:hypothetical protein
MNEKMQLTRIESTNNVKKVFSFKGDLNRMRTSNKTMNEKRNKKKKQH